MPIDLNNISSGYNLSVINENFQRIENEWDEKLDRQVSAQGNQMEQDLDMNGNDILNATLGGVTTDEIRQATDGANAAAESATQATTSANEAAVEATRVAEAYRAQYIGDYSLPNKTYNRRGEFLAWPVSDGGDGNDYIYIGPESGLPYTTDIATYPSPGSDPNLQLNPAATAAYVSQAIEDYTGGLGNWTASVTVFQRTQDYAVFNGVRYQTKVGTTLPYTAQGADPTALPDSTFVESFNNVNSKNATINFSSVANMISTAEIGDKCSTGRTEWVRGTDTNGDITDFSPTTHIHVIDFGGESDGTTDYSPHFITADVICTRHNRNIMVENTGNPYIVSDVNIRNSVDGIGRPTIRSNHTTKAQLTGFRSEHTGETFFGKFVRGIIFDGNASADPVDWETDFDAFTGTMSFRVFQWEDFGITDCEFNNSYFSGLRLDGCKRGLISNCKITRGRGNFGDNVVITSESEDILVQSTHASDHTRIGFVCESGARNIKFNQCTARNGHDCSRAYGGVEQNRAFWAENSIGITFDSCTAIDEWVGGFVVTSTENPVNVPLYSYPDTGDACFAELINCRAINIGAPSGIPVPLPFAAGFLIGSFAAQRNQVNVTGCRAYNCDIGYNISPALATGTVNLTDCYGESTATGGSHGCFFIGNSDSVNTVKVNITNCSGKLLDYTFVNSTGANVGDITCNSIGKVDLTVTNYTNEDDRASIKFSIVGSDSQVRVEKFKGQFQIDAINSQSFIIDSEVATSGNTHIGRTGVNNAAARLTLRDVSIRNLLDVNNIEVKGSCRVFGSFGRISQNLDSSFDPTRNPPLDLRVDIEKSINSQSSLVNAPVVLQYNSVANGIAILSGVWKNTGGGGVPADYGFIYVGDRTVTRAHANGVISDSSVPNQVAATSGSGGGFNFAAGGQVIGF